MFYHCNNYISDGVNRCYLEQYKIELKEMDTICNFITNPDWWGVIATFVAAFVAAWITDKLGKMQNELQQKQVDIQERQNDLQAQQVKLQEQQNELQRQQIQQQEYELYRKMYSQVYGVDFFNKTILLRIVAILISNKDNKLRLKFVDDIWEECEKRTMEFTECALDMELKQCGEALDAKYYSDALQASQKVIQMFKYFVENELMAFVASECKKFSKQISNMNISYMLSRIGYDMNVIHNECEKLCFYASDVDVIEKHHIDEICIVTLENTLLFFP